MRRSNTLDKSIKLADAFYLAFMAAGENTLLPEIYRAIGYEATIKLIEMFSGSAIQIPDVSVIRMAVRDATIFIEGKSGSSYEVLAEKHGLTTQQVRSVLLRMKGLHRRV